MAGSTSFAEEVRHLGGNDWEVRGNKAVEKRMIDELRAADEARQAGAEEVWIGLTLADMRIDVFGWDHSMNFRRAGRFAILSLADLGRGSPSNLLDAERLRVRLRKLALKDAGMLVYRLLLSDNDTNVLAAGFRSAKEVDEAGEHFLDAE